MIDQIAGPWIVASTATNWYVMKETGIRKKKIGSIGSNRINYKYRAIEEANRRNEAFHRANGTWSDSGNRPIRDQSAPVQQLQEDADIADYASSG